MLTIPKVVSVVGDTHVGKSTIIAHILTCDTLSLFSFRVTYCTSKPAVADPQQNEPTTANVNFFDGDMAKPGAKEPNPIRLLDFEGENGGRPPKVLLIFVEVN